MNPFGTISGGAGGISAGSSASGDQTVGGAGGFGFGAVNTGTSVQGIDKTTIAIVAAAAVVAIYLVKR